MKRIFSLSPYLPRLGGWYIILVVFIAQLTAIPGAILGTISINFNAEFTPATITEISQYSPLIILTGNSILLAIAWYLTPNARKRLDAWANNQLRADPKEERNAWSEITAFTWRYGILAFFVSYLVDIVPSTLYYYSVQKTTFDQMIYSLIGGLVSVLAIIIIAVLVIDRLLVAPRLALVPTSFDLQLSGLAGPRLTAKFQILIFTLIAIGILMVAPVGYHYMTESLTPQNQGLRQQFQFEAIIVSILALILGLALSYFIARTVYVPLNDLITTLKAIEAGDLTKRAEITATDEIAEVALHFNQMVESLEKLQNNLEQQVEERTRLLKATNELAKVSSSTLDLDDLLAKVIELFTDQFNYYYAAIYLVDAGGKWAELKEATGEAGKVLKQNRHRLDLTGKSMVASCIREKTPRIVQNTSEEKQRVDNPLLPYTRSEIALPLMTAERVLGALNVQSAKTADFGLQAIETIQNMAAQVTIAMENARLFQEANARINEMRVIQQQYLLEGWSALSATKEELEYRVGESNDANTQKITSAFNLRDQIIGEIAIEGTSTWSLDQKNLVDAVANQAAIALENARLVHESRQLAAHERMLAEINSKIWSSNTIDTVLQTAIKELGRRLDASNASIELKLDDPEN